MSIENASYMENTPRPHTEENSISINHGLDDRVNSEAINEEEHTPQLFEEENASGAETRSDDSIDTHTEKLFDKEFNEEEDFEIPAFLRKTKILMIKHHHYDQLLHITGNYPLSGDVE